MDSGEFIQVGFTALREKGTGAFYEPVPLYIRADDKARAGEETLMEEVGGLLARAMKSYMERCGEEGVKV